MTNRIFNDEVQMKVFVTGSTGLVGQIFTSLVQQRMM